MANPLIRKLGAFSPLTVDDRQFLLDITRSQRALKKGDHIRREGDVEGPNDIRLIAEGFAVRYKFAETGARQIVAYLIPGDFCDLHGFVLKYMDHSILTLTPVKVVEIPRKRVLEMMQRPTLARALWWTTLVEEAILREWLVNVGQRGAAKRIAHLFCEIYARLELVGFAGAGRFELPMTQADLADSLGLSTVHVNRGLRELHKAKLLSFRRKRVDIIDLERLQEMSGFDAKYLHIEPGEGQVRPGKAAGRAAVDLIAK